MAYFRCGGGGAAALHKIPYTGEYHNIQSNRSITIEGYKLIAPITAQTNCVGIISIPVTMPTNTNAIVIKYQLQGPSYIGGNYSSTLFCSDVQMSGITDRISSYGNRLLQEKAINAGGEDSIVFYDAIQTPGNSFYLNIQLGTSNYKSIELFAI